MTSRYQILDTHTFCSKWSSRHNLHLRLRIRCDIAV